MLLDFRINGKIVNGPTQIINDVYIENLGTKPPNKGNNEFFFVKIV